jgi:hypothetical protein
MAEKVIIPSLFAPWVVCVNMNAVGSVPTVRGSALSRLRVSERHDTVLNVSEIVCSVSEPSAVDGQILKAQDHWIKISSHSHVLDVYC